MVMTRRSPECKEETREGEGIFQQEEAWMTTVHEDTIVHPFMLRLSLHSTASRRIIQDGRSKKFQFGELGHRDFWEHFVEVGSEANVDYLDPLLVNFETFPLNAQ